MSTSTSMNDFAPVPPRSAVEQRTSQCDCTNALRPYGHDQGCCHYRPLKDWSDKEIEAAEDGIAARRRLALRALGRARARYEAAVAYHCKTLFAHNAAHRLVDDLGQLADEVRRERARREAAEGLIARQAGGVS